MSNTDFTNDASPLPRWCPGCGELIGKCVTAAKIDHLKEYPEDCQCCCHPRSEHTNEGCMYAFVNDICPCVWPKSRKY